MFAVSRHWQVPERRSLCWKPGPGNKAGLTTLGHTFHLSTTTKQLSSNRKPDQPGTASCLYFCCISSLLSCVLGIYFRVDGRASSALNERGRQHPQIPALLAPSTSRASPQTPITASNAVTLRINRARSSLHHGLNSGVIYAQYPHSLVRELLLPTYAHTQYRTNTASLATKPDSFVPSSPSSASQSSVQRI